LSDFIDFMQRSNQLLKTNRRSQFSSSFNYKRQGLYKTKKEKNYINDLKFIDHDSQCNNETNASIKKNRSFNFMKNDLNSKISFDLHETSSADLSRENLDEKEEFSSLLESTIKNMQKSFEAYRIQDNSIKTIILKEILECQNFLLNNAHNLQPNQRENISMNQIYDEWKILAMIIDRICFFVYLTALIVTSSIFYFMK
jgi:hypothetical protein